MRKTRKLAAFCAVFLLIFSFFCTAVYAEPAEETPTEQPPAETVTETIEPPEDEFTIGDIPPGVGTVVAAFTDEDGRKFYTIQTPAGNTFYLIIDFTLTGQNVYFLDAVNETDLLALAEKAKSGQPGGNISAIPDPKNPASSQPPGEPGDPKPETPNTGSNFTMLLVVLVVVIGGGAGYYFKIYRKKRDADGRDEYEETEEYRPDEPEEYEADNSPPWEEDDEDV